MRDSLDFIVKDRFLTDLQLEKLQKTLAPFGIEVNYRKGEGEYDLNLNWDPSKVYKKSNRYAGRHKEGTGIDWEQVKYLKQMGMTNEEIADHLGVNIRTFYRRKNDKKAEQQSD